MSTEYRNPFLNPGLVRSYDAWYETVGRRADRLEKALLQMLLRRFPSARTVLDVGCGTGHFTRWFREQGLDATGLDVSPAMLAEAHRLESPTCIQGNALDLPFEECSYDLVSLITTLEFVEHADRALSEAVRVAGQGMLLGVLNRESRLGRQLVRSAEDPWKAARLFTPAELTALVKVAAGQRLQAVVWRTTLWPLWSSSLPLPGGGFVGVAVHLVDCGGENS